MKRLEARIATELSARSLCRDFERAYAAVRLVEARLAATRWRSAVAFVMLGLVMGIALTLLALMCAGVKVGG